MNHSKHRPEDGRVLATVRYLQAIEGLEDGQLVQLKSLLGVIETRLERSRWLEDAAAPEPGDCESVVRLCQAEAIVDAVYPNDPSGDALATVTRTLAELLGTARHADDRAETETGRFLVSIVSDRRVRRVPVLHGDAESQRSEGHQTA